MAQDKTSHFDTLAATAGLPDIKEKLLKGYEMNGTTYKAHLDHWTDKSPTASTSRLKARQPRWNLR